MKRIHLIVIMLVIAMNVFIGGKTYASDNYKIQHTGNGTVKVSTDILEKNMKIQVQKESTKYNYVYNTATEELPLQLGKGLYTVKVLRLVEGTTYKVIEKKDITYDGSVDDKTIFTQSINSIDWNTTPEIKELSNKLIKVGMTDTEKMNVFYKYITTNIKYDNDKVKKLTNTYMPEIKNTLETKKGICYDYSSLFAGLLRHNNIPAKLIKGYEKNNSKVYHAWNEVYIEGQWRIMDLTYDATFYQYKIKVDKFKSVDMYLKDKEF